RDPEKNRGVTSAGWGGERGAAGVSAQLRASQSRAGREPSGALDICSKQVFGRSSMGKTLFALAVVAALGLGSLCTTGSAGARPVRSPDALPIAAASADLADQVVLVCRTRRVCGPM